MGCIGAHSEPAMAGTDRITMLTIRTAPAYEHSLVSYVQEIVCSSK